MTQRVATPIAASLFLLLAVSMQPALAYNPPTDTQGPLKVTIEGPSEVTETGVALPVKVLLENSGDHPVSGTLRLAVIDRWTADPGKAVAFQVAPGAKEPVEFSVTAGAGTYSGHYPIHAYAEFELDGRKQTAHPILVLQTKLPLAERERPELSFDPIVMAPNSELALWRVETHRSVIAPNGKPARTMPVGWQGSDEETRGNTAISTETLDGVSKSCIVIHPPWSQGNVGTQWIEYPVSLPESTPIRLTFANAMTPTGESDGVTFRVRVAPIDAPDGTPGEVVFERHTAAKTWTQAQADLSPFAGKTVRLQLESHPGPKNNTGWDRSYWAEPLLIAGTPAEAMPFPPRRGMKWRHLGSITTAGRTYDPLLWPGNRGLLDATIGFSDGNKTVFFRGFQIKVLGGRIDDTRSPILLEKVTEEPVETGVCLRHHFRSRMGAFDLVGYIRTDAGGLKASFKLENIPEAKPWQACYLEEVAVGSWSRAVAQVYCGDGNVIRRPQNFELSFDGHRLSTSFVGIDFDGGLSMLQASDVPPLKLKVAPEDNTCALHTAHDCTLTLIPAANAWDAVKLWRTTNGLKAAGGVKKAAGRFVFDLWGGRYGESAEALRKSFRYGLTDSMVVWHNWQRWGYDYRLPNICPPNPHLGTLQEMQDLSKACAEAGVVFAPHDNYIDFYPDADGFSYEKVIAFHQSGQPVKAWINKGRDAQSYRYRADVIDPFLKSNVAWIHDNLAATGYFIDVWSSARPYSYWTSDGRFVPATYTQKKWGELFAWIRDELGGDAPQISESGHDGLIGWLDGAQTNHLRVGEPLPGDRGWCVWNWKCDDAERTPWFDAAHHDRFILHGAGYGSRYAGGLDPAMHGMYSDDYICTEVLTGHPAMVSRPFGRNVVRKYWLTHDLMRALALQTIENVTYADGDLHRQYVEWSGGAKVWVNRGQSDWEVNKVTLPQYGFFAEAVDASGGTVMAGIARRGGAIVEFAYGGEKLYANGRLLVDQAWPIRMNVDSLQSKDGRQFVLDLTWQADVPVPDGHRGFLHFCDDEGEILFQASQQSDPFRAGEAGRFTVKATGSIPEDARVGDEYELDYGIYSPGSGGRLHLAGPNTPDQRVRAGHLVVEGEGDKITGLAWRPYVPKPDPFLARWNPEASPIDFGIFKTAGGCQLGPEGKSLVVTPLPGDRAPVFDVTLSWDRLPWKNLSTPHHLEALAEDGTVLTKAPISATDGIVTFQCKPGVFAYRLVGQER